MAGLGVCVPLLLLPGLLQLLQPRPAPRPGHPPAGALRTRHGSIPGSGIIMILNNNNNIIITPGAPGLVRVGGQLRARDHQRPGHQPALELGGDRLPEEARV